MGFDKGRRGDRGGRGRDRFDGFGDDSFGGGYGGGGFGGRDRFGGGGGGDRFGGGGDRFGGGGGGDRFGGGRPQMPAQVIGSGKGQVKFFNSSKGFGFIAPEDGSADIFVHISAVEQAGLAGLADGQPVSYSLVDRGGRVSATDLQLDGDPLPVQERAPREPRAGGPGGGGFGGPRGGGRPQRELTGDKATGTVKFFNAMKGFGFVARDDGQPDVFVHVSAVERAGMNGLKEGDKIGFDIEVDNRGKYAAVNLTPGD